MKSQNGDEKKFQKSYKNCYFDSYSRNWVISVFKREDARIKEDQEFIAVYQEETDKLREEVVELRRNDTVFSTSQCGACNHPIENPSVHFGCQHSYHQHCFKVL